MNQNQLREKLEKLHADSFGWALRCCFDDHTAAEDVSQTVYLKTLEGRAKFNGKAEFKTWLFAVIRNTAIDFIKKEKRFRSIEFVTSEMEEINEVSFQNALNQLSPQQNQILHLVFYQNLTIEEASEIMKIQIGTARTHYERGKRQLKKRLIINQNFQQ
jgi:RNA polymerase sigma factor (sigma-70 family)